MPGIQVLENTLRDNTLRESGNVLNDRTRKGKLLQQYGNWSSSANFFKTMIDNVFEYHIKIIRCQ